MTLLNQFPHIMWYIKHNGLHQMFFYNKHIGESKENLHFSLTEQQIKEIYQMQNN